MNKKGFMLIELLIVVVILSILSARLMHVYMENEKKAQATEGVLLLDSILTAERVYSIDNATYITDTDTVNTLQISTSGNKYYNTGWKVTLASASGFMAQSPATPTSAIPTVLMFYNAAGGATFYWDKDGGTNFVAW